MIGISNKVWKRAFAWVGVGIVALPGIASAASVSGVINKYIEATGGREAQEAITSAIQKGEVDIVEFGMQAEITLFHRGDDFRSVMVIPNMGEVVSGVTEGVVWSTDPMQGSRVLEGGEAEAVLEQASLNPLLDWRDKYSSAEIVGEEDGMTKIKGTSESGRSTTMYFDQKTGLLTRIDRSDLNGDTTIRFSDYKKVGDVLIAHKLAVESPQANAELTIDVILLNVDIDDKTFELPSEILALLPEKSTTVAASAPVAEAGASRAEKAIALLDADGDGKISLEESSSRGDFRDNFAFFDKNGDGLVDLAELLALSQGGQTAPPEPVPAAEDDDFSVEQLMTFMDTDGNGKISLDEASPGEFKDNFAFIDTNGDGFADSTELKVAMAFSQGGETAPAEPAPAAEGGDFSVEQVMTFMDTNGDGKISLDEASPGEFKDNFAFVDTNGDGFADLAELAVAMAFSDGGQASTPDPAPAGEITAEQLMTFMDTNGDGKITMDEAPEDVKQGFSFIDTNGDGGIDVKEAQIMVDFAKNQ